MRYQLRDTQGKGTLSEFQFHQYLLEALASNKGVLLAAEDQHRGAWSIDSPGNLDSLSVAAQSLAGCSNRTF